MSFVIYVRTMIAQDPKTQISRAADTVQHQVKNNRCPNMGLLYIRLIQTNLFNKLLKQMQHVKRYIILSQAQTHPLQVRQKSDVK